MLRGVNLGPKRRVPMAELRAVLTEAGYDEVRTLLASGNVVLASRTGAARLQAECDRLLSAHFGFAIATVVRTGAELRAVVAADPLAHLVEEPKRYLVTFLAAALPSASRKRLRELETGAERWAARRREIYSWHPDGLARSELGKWLSGPRLGVTGTARNWRTVCALRDLSLELEQ
jgi:uncharacterized protein (DUF1697 family)